MADKKTTPIEKVAAFCCINTSLDLFEQAIKMMETAHLLYPEMEPKRYDKIYKLAHSIATRCRPAGTMNWEL